MMPQGYAPITKGTPQMTDPTQVPIVQCTYQLALTMQRLVAKFPKHLRFQLGDRLAGRTQDLLEGVIRANLTRDPILRSATLATLANDLFAIRITLRLVKDLKAISTGQFSEISLCLEDIQKQLTGWTKWTQTQQSITP